MICSCVLAAVLVGSAAAADGPKAAVGQKIGYVNIAKVLRDSDRSKAGRVAVLERRDRMQANLVGLRAMLARLPQPANAPAPTGVVPAGLSLPIPVPPTESRDAQLLRRLIEDAERKTATILNDQSSGILTAIYDDISAAACEMAKEYGLSAVLAYPDAVTPEERNSPLVKELKLKPPTAQPFLVAPTADYTDRLLQRLNAKPEPTVRKPVPTPAKPDAKAAVVGQKTGFFNMAAVMRDFKRAPKEVQELNTLRGELSRDLGAWRSEYVNLQREIQDPKTSPLARDTMSKRMIELARKIEDKDREVNKTLNDRATAVISALYDDINAVVVELAQDQGLSAVLAYPDAVTAEEKNSPQIKELKLKPPGCQPFYLDPSVDFTGEVVKRLNARYEAKGGK